MLLDDFEQRLKTENLLKIYDNGSWKQYHPLITKSPFGLINCFGICKNISDNCYIIYITDNERGGIPYYTSKAATIDIACEKLYRYISLCDKSYKEEHSEYHSELN